MSELKLQAGADSVTASKDPKLGIVAVRLKLWAPTLLEALTGAVPSAISGVSGLVESQPRTATRDVAGDQAGYHVDATFEGIVEGESVEGEEFILDGDLSEERIETHPNYMDLIKEYNGNTNEETDGKATWPTEYDSGDPNFYSVNPMHGVESFLSPGLVWTRRWVSRTLPHNLVRQLGTVDNPPGNPPELVDRMQWLFIRAGAAYRGNVWQLQASWKSIGRHFVAPQLYRYT